MLSFQMEVEISLSFLLWWAIQRSVSSPVDAVPVEDGSVEPLLIVRLVRGVEVGVFCTKKSKISKWFSIDAQERTTLVYNGLDQIPTS